MNKNTKNLWIVYTHLGPFETWAVSAKQALANIRYRLFGTRYDATTSLWTVREAAA